MPWAQQSTSTSYTSHRKVGVSTRGTTSWAPGRAGSSCPQCPVPERTLACRLTQLPSQTPGTAGPGTASACHLGREAGGRKHSEPALPQAHWPSQPCCPWSQESLLPPRAGGLPRKGSANARPGPSHRHQPAVLPGRAHTLTRGSRRPGSLSWRKLGSSTRDLAGRRGCRSVSSSCASSPHVSAHAPPSLWP